MSKNNKKRQQGAIREATLRVVKLQKKLIAQSVAEGKRMFAKQYWEDIENGTQG